MGVISDQARSPGDVMRRLAELERAVENLRNARVLENAAIGAGGLRVHSGGSVRIQDGGELEVTGDITVLDGGRFIVKYPDNIGTDHSAVYFGDLYSAGVYIGTGILGQRPDGSTIWAAMTNTDGTAHSFGVRDNQDKEVLAVRDDTPRGLALPAFSIHCGPDDYTVWPGTDETEWDTIYEGGAYAYSPKTWIMGKASADASDTEGEVRLILHRDGTDYVLHTRTDIGFGIGGIGGAADLPAGIPIGGYMYVRMQARRTAGTGKIRGAILQAVLYGI